MRPIAIDDFCAVRSLANVTFSPEGTTACFTVSQAKKEKNCYDSRLYTLKDGVVRALTSGGKESSFCYLDENTVLFAGDREGEKEPSLQSRFYRIALDGGEADLNYESTDNVLGCYQLVKGMEFDAVIVVWPEAELNDAERRRLYTACSRALHSVTLLADGALIRDLGIVL